MSSVLIDKRTGDEHTFTQSQLDAAIRSGKYRGKPGEVYHVVDEWGERRTLGPEGLEDIYTEDGTDWAPESQASLQHRTIEKELEDRYGSGVLTGIRTYLEAAARGFSVGGSDWLLASLGASRKGLRERRSRWGGTTVTEIGGAIAPILLTGGAAAPASGASVAKAGVTGVRAAVSTAAPRAGILARTPAAGAFRVGEKARAAVAARMPSTAGRGVVARTAGRAVPFMAGAGVESAIFGAGMASSSALLSEDPLTAESVFSKMLDGGLYGGAYGTALGGGLSVLSDAGRGLLAWKTGREVAKTGEKARTVMEGEAVAAKTGKGSVAGKADDATGRPKPDFKEKGAELDDLYSKRDSLQAKYDGLTTPETAEKIKKLSERIARNKEELKKVKGAPEDFTELGQTVERAPRASRIEFLNKQIKGDSMERYGLQTKEQISIRNGIKDLTTRIDELESLGYVRRAAGKADDAADEKLRSFSDDVRVFDDFAGKILSRAKLISDVATLPRSARDAVKDLLEKRDVFSSIFAKYKKVDSSGARSGRHIPDLTDEDLLSILKNKPELYTRMIDSLNDLEQSYMRLHRELHTYVPDAGPVPSWRHTSDMAGEQVHPAGFLQALRDVSDVTEGFSNLDKLVATSEISGQIGGPDAGDLPVIGSAMEMLTKYHIASRVLGGKGLHAITPENVKKAGIVAKETSEKVAAKAGGIGGRVGDAIAGAGRLGAYRKVKGVAGHGFFANFIALLSAGAAGRWLKKIWSGEKGTPGGIRTWIGNTREKAVNKMAGGVGTFLQGTGKARLAAPASTAVMLESLKLGDIPMYSMFHPESDKSGFKGDIRAKQPSRLQKAYLMRAEELSAAVASPMQTMERIHSALANVRAVDPLLATHLASMAYSTLTRMHARLPSNPGHGAIDGLYTRHIPPDYEIAKFARYASAVKDPVSVLERMVTSKLTKEEAAAIRENYPETYRRIQMQLLSEAPNLKKKLSYGQLTQMSVLWDTPLDTTMRPQFINVLQGMYKAQYGDQQKPNLRSVRQSIENEQTQISRITQ